MNTFTKLVNQMSAEATMKENIRYLGRVLGEVIKDNEGDKTFETIEAIRLAAVKFHRTGDEKFTENLDGLLKDLTTSQTIAVVRAFSYFKHLVNIAEDLNSHHQNRLDENVESVPNYLRKVAYWIYPHLVDASYRPTQAC